MGVPAIVIAASGSSQQERSASERARASFAIPDYRNVIGAVQIMLDVIGGTLNILIFFTQPGTIKWEEIRKVADDPGKPFLTANLCTEPWVYVCCDYSVGAMLGLIEELTGLQFKEGQVPQEQLPDGLEACCIRYFHLPHLLPR